MAVRKSKKKPAKKKAPKKKARVAKKAVARTSKSRSKKIVRKVKAAARKPKKVVRKAKKAVARKVPARKPKPALRKAKTTVRKAAAAKTAPKIIIKSKAALPYRRGVGIALVNRKGEVFVAERFDLPGAWQMPQGGIDKGETPRQAVMRELKEETGTDKARIIGVTSGWLRYDLPKDIQRLAWKGKYRGQEQQWFLMRFTGRDEQIDITGGGHNREFARWTWLPFRDLPKMIVGFKRDMYRKVVAVFAAKALPARSEDDVTDMVEDAA